VRRELVLALLEASGFFDVRRSVQITERQR
jgi:hypothetical protein